MKFNNYKIVVIHDAVPQIAYLEVCSIICHCHFLWEREKKKFVWQTMKENFSTSFYFELQSRAPLLLKLQYENTRKKMCWNDERLSQEMVEK